MVEVTSLNEPDPSWVFVDSAGHEHRWVGDWQHSTLPSCHLVVDHVCTDECDDLCYNRTHYECVRCGDRVEPRRRPSPRRRFIPTGFRSDTGALELEARDREEGLRR